MPAGEVAHHPAAGHLHRDAAPVFEDFLRSLHDLYAEFSDDELRSIVRLATEVARRQHEATRRLPASGR